MSKEQTPITAWDFYKNSDTANVYEVMEQYAQYREKKAVQEALEEEIEEAWIDGMYSEFYPSGSSATTSKEYYETQVKPKYE
jgi:hypothetical protein